jgi:predicted MFS family arabinose efflux permease
MGAAEDAKRASPDPQNREHPLVITTFRASFGLLTTRRFGTFWFASLLSSIGTWAQQVAEPWLLLNLGASSFMIGLDSFAINAPVLLLTLIGGALADRSDRRRVIALFQSIQMMCPTAVVLLVAAGLVRPWMIIGLSLVVGTTDALSMPSFQSIVPSIVTPDQISTGLALNATQFNLSRILGPTLAGVLMSSIGAMACFVVSAASYVPFIGIALWILPRRTLPAPSADPHHRRPLIASVGEALRQTHLRGALLTVLVTGILCGPLITFTPVLVKGVFHGSATSFSVAIGSFGVGGLLGAIGLLGVGPNVDRRRLSSAFAVTHGALLVLTGLSPWLWGIPPLLALAGASMTVINTAANSVLQGSTGPRALGQAVSLYMLAMRGGISIGALLTGAAVNAFGVRRALLANGLVAVVVQLAVARLWLRTRLFESNPF